MKRKQSVISKSCFIIFAGFCFAVNGNGQVTDLTATHLRTEYKEDPFTEASQPRLSWELTSSRRAQVQSAYQVLVATSPILLNEPGADLWNSGKMTSNETNQVKYAGKPLSSRTACYWKVRSWDKEGKAGKWSAAKKWEMALLNKSDWTATFIGNDLTALGKGNLYHLPPAPFFRKEILLNGTIKKARLYVSALGLFEFYINGKKIGNDHFTPGYTDYDKRVYYLAYDVTQNIKNGKNVFGAIVSDGWYAGYLGYALLVQNPVLKNFYGKVPMLKAQVEIEFNDGKKIVIATNETWKTNHGPFIEADILNGETYDARKEFEGWASAGFKDDSWKPSQLFSDKDDRALQVYPGNPVEVFTELKAISVVPKKGGKYLFDLGQNFAGNVRLKVKGKAGDTIVMKYGEVLFPNGDLMRENLRMARATDTYILKGDPKGETYTPRFTYHGFQFVEVSGLKSAPGKDAITGIVLTSATPIAGNFETDNKMVNQLYHNIVWTQRSNYFDIPTDCPQRDERMGWTGDAQTYVQSATFNNDIAAFFTKWIVDLNDGQRPDNTYPIYAPAPSLRVTDTYSPGWSEAGIICPYTIFKSYGDTRVIEKSWPNMVAFMDFLETKSKGNYFFTEGSFEDISPKGGFGDWLSVGRKTPPDMLATMYYSYVASMMAEMAAATGKTGDATKFRTITQKINQAFLTHYTNGKGRFITNAAIYGNGDGYIDGNMGFDGHTQTAYANAVYMNLLPPGTTKSAGDSIAVLVKENGNRLTTGFLGVKPLLPALSVTGHSDVAYSLLLSKQYPSWGFEIENGANTIWERWNSFTKEKGFENNAGMNSFNHYAFGSVNEWLFGNAAGIKVEEPGYRTFIIRPEIAPQEINYVKATYNSINGAIISSWKKNGATLELTVEVPVNTKARIFIPSEKNDKVLENEHLLQSNTEMTVGEWKDGYISVEAGSGLFHFSVKK
ncbi:MAG: family 78 glycoside hydrolase catalytic domain [Chitinophagaceae bacterium]